MEVEVRGGLVRVEAEGVAGFVDVEDDAVFDFLGV